MSTAQLTRSNPVNETLVLAIDAPIALVAQAARRLDLASCVRDAGPCTRLSGPITVEEVPPAPGHALALELSWEIDADVAATVVARWDLALYEGLEDSFAGLRVRTWIPETVTRERARIAERSRSLARRALRGIADAADLLADHDGESGRQVALVARAA
jgi:hypothetical protein